jgi:hypothetical protein
MSAVNRLCLAAISGAAFISIAAKAYSAAFTHDEAFTFLHYVPLPPIDIINFKNPIPNNHILNTLAMKLCSTLFGDREWSLRLPNVLSFGLYCLSVKQITGRLRTSAAVVPCAVLLMANPFLLDFFALARGYGLAVALVTASAAQYLSFLDTRRTRHYSLALLAAGLAILANAATIYYAVSLIGLHNLITLNHVVKAPRNRDAAVKTILRANKATAVAVIVGGAILYEPLRRLMGVPIEVGGVAGLWADTVTSLVNSTAYGHGGTWLPVVMKAGVLGGGLAVAAYWLAATLKSGWRVLDRREDVCFMSGAACSILLISSVHHHLTGTPYLTDRFALFVVPLFVAGVLLVLDRVPRGTWLALATSALAVAMAVHTLRSLDVHTVFAWPYDASDELVIERLIAEQRRHPADSVRLGITWVFEPSLNYYRLTRRLEWLQPLDRNGFSALDDYRYVLEPDLPQVAEYKTQTQLAAFDASRSFLFAAHDPD